VVRGTPLALSVRLYSAVPDSPSCVLLPTYGTLVQSPWHTAMLHHCSFVLCTAMSHHHSLVSQSQPWSSLLIHHGSMLAIWLLLGGLTVPRRVMHCIIAKQPMLYCIVPIRHLFVCPGDQHPQWQDIPGPQPHSALDGSLPQAPPHPTHLR
jgi:hypothetical protein